jgi:hypothetical protein
MEQPGGEDESEEAVEKAEREKEAGLEEMEESSEEMRSDLEDLEERAGEFGDDVDEARQDWERRKADDSVPGAEPDDGGEG